MKSKTEQKHLDVLNSCEDYVKGLGFEFDVAKIRSSTRKEEWVLVRAVIVSYLRRHKYSLGFIGACINRDHATILYLSKYAEKVRFGRPAPESVMKNNIEETEALLDYHREQIKILNKKLTAYKSIRKKALSLNLL